LTEEQMWEAWRPLEYTAQGLIYESSVKRTPKELHLYRSYSV
jgi:hypothetical protein